MSLKDGNPSNTKKMVTIGDAQVGKSSLLYRLVHKETPHINSATIGAAFYCTNLNNNFRLNMWDTAGQERFRSMVPIYLKDTDVILFVYDIADLKSFEHLRDYWIEFALTHSSKDGNGNKNTKPAKTTTNAFHSHSLPQLPNRSLSYASERGSKNYIIQSHNKMSTPKQYNVRENGPICIIVANKCDLSYSAVPNSEGIELAKRIGGSFIETSAKMGTNTEELLVHIEEKLEVIHKGGVQNDTEFVLTNDTSSGIVLLTGAKNYVSDLVSPVTNCNC